MQLETWHLWLIACFILLVAEIFTTGFVVALFGAACIAPTALAYMGYGLAWQLAGFGIATVLALVFVRPIVIKLKWHDTPGSATNVDALIGRDAVVTERIEPVAGSGSVQVGGEHWKAAARSREAIDAGEHVTVREVTGCTLVVERRG